MNRRAFLLGTIATPIAAKVGAVSAALRPIAKASLGYGTRAADVVSFTGYELNNLLIYSNSFIASWVEPTPPLDSRREPWHDGKAGRDQIG